MRVAVSRVLLSDSDAFHGSLLQDEVLAHRLGLVPLMADPRAFEFRTGRLNFLLPKPVVSHVKGCYPSLDSRRGHAENGKADESNTIVLKLKVACQRSRDGELVNEKGADCALPKHEQHSFASGFRVTVLRFGLRNR
jgi:DNA-directed RNA polymerase alpha subunit